ncbi:MAG: DNA-binding response regulator [uncultured Sulfurovum sp.]|uniref:DNA-binding response regulator n=1 Tax=uncultured Sulfurovum sp. TaxID=269237 RepID=A0A6S6TRY9_9BACT|nr:MAG: DNA-binding response regulator [uncultured Sulfurovum sp.]
MQTNFKDLTILYVEDDDIIRKNAQMYLNKICKKVWLAKDGLEALELYEDYSPDIIISDIKMPRLSGLDMASKIRKTDKSTPIILATAFTDTTYLLQAVELQLIKYLVKPITSTKLLEALKLANEHLKQDTLSLIQLNENTVYDTLNKTLIIDNEVIKLTKNELLLLDILAKHTTRAVTYNEIENYIWLDGFMSMDTLRSLMRSLRKKLRNIMIENVSGVGYRLKI